MFDWRLAKKRPKGDKNAAEKVRVVGGNRAMVEVVDGLKMTVVVGGVDLGSRR